VVVDGVGDLPINVQRHLVREGLNIADVKGVFSAGRSYVVAANLESVKEGIKTALHEAIGHEGIRIALGKRFKPVMRTLYESFPREHEVWQTVAARYGYLDTGTDDGRIAFAEEVTAHMAESAPEMGELDMIKAEIRANLREQFPELPLEEWEVHALIQRSRESLILRHGEPARVEALQEKLTRRTEVAQKLHAYERELGKGGPDPLSLALYQQGSRVLDPDGLPTRLYHGDGRDVGTIKGTFWGSTDPGLANDYAGLRASMKQTASVVPYYADIRRPFDGDPLAAVKTTHDTPDGLTVAVFVEEVIKQSGVEDVTADGLRELGRTLRQHGRREESGPSYSPQDFWYEPHMMFGRDGREVLNVIFSTAGFDGVRYTEQGALTYGAFDASQLHFMDQGATLRGWQPDRGHGVGPDSQAAFARWFGASKAVDAEGKPLRLYHGTASDFSVFGTGRGAIYTTPEANIAAAFADATDAEEWETEEGQTAGPVVMPVYLSLQNPLVLDQAWAEDYLDETGELDWIAVDNVLENAADEGYDGAILKGIVDFAGTTENSRGEFERETRAYDQYIAFRPEQIKSALTNVGTYDPSNPDIRYAITAFHGSPHTFERFELSKVGIGEGNQVYGHGLYFASMEAVASAYMFAGKGTRLQVDGRSLLARENTQAAKEDPLFNQAIGYLSLARSPAQAIEMAVEDDRPSVAERLQAMLDADRIQRVAPGNLYEVTLRPDEADLLDWDAPIAEQSRALLDRLIKAGVSLTPDMSRSADDVVTGKSVYRALVMQADEETFTRQGPIWAFIKDDPNRLTYSMDAIASRYLASIGVPGLRYYDGDSRVAGGGSHNYVIFDDALIQVTDVRYKLATSSPESALPTDDIVPPAAFKRWFGESAVTDAQGNPLVVYHGAKKAGFTEFDTDGQGKTAGTGAFFTETRFGASSYSETQDDAVMFDREEFLADPEGHGVVVEVDSDDDFIAYGNGTDGTGQTREDALENLADNIEYDNENASGVYPVYLSLQQPFIVDARGANWDAITTEWVIYNADDDLVDFIHDPDEIDGYLKENPTHTVEPGVSKTTDELAREAREIGCDGLIVNNVVDSGPGGNGSSDDVIYVAFKPSQIKSIYNVGSYDPNNDDIRYSLAPSASEAPNIRTYDPRQIPSTLLHGTESHGFTAFERKSINDGYFFTNDMRLAEGFAGVSGRLIEAEMSLTNPADLRGEPDAWEGFHGAGLMAQLQAAGFDGAVYYEPPGDYATGNELVYVAFNAEDIRITGSSPMNGQPAPEQRSGFDRWFAESVVVDAKGQPLTVYSGPPDARGIIAEGFKPSPTRGAVYFATDSYGVADTYADDSRALDYQNAEPQTLALHLSIRNPYMVDGKGQRWRETERHIQEARALGHDGIIIKNSRDEYNHTGNGGRLSTVYAVFDATQIAAADPDAPLSSRIDGIPLGNLSVLDRRQWEGAPPAPTVERDDIRLSFAGESARTAPRLQCQYAQKALSAGIDPEVLRQETGWFQGAEGRWRFEISDHEAKVRYGESTSSNPDVYIDWSDEAEHREKGVPLGNVLDHPALFAAYPELKSYRVKVLPPEVMGGALAGFDEDERTVKMVDPYSLPLKKPGVDPVLSVILHELQHSVQSIEGFARGGNVERIRRDAGAQVQSLANREVVEDAEYILAEWERAGFDSIDDFVAYVPCANFEVWQDATIHLAKHPERLAECRRKINAYDNAPAAYRQLAGEVEARNVEARLSMTEEQRQQESPQETADVSPEQHVVLPNERERAALTPTVTLQTIDQQEGRVVNHTTAGEILQSSAAEMIDILDSCGLDVGWQDGGCRIFAEALHAWSAGAIELGVMAKGNDTTASHAVGVLMMPGQTLLLDSDGVGTAEELSHKLAVLERTQGESLVATGEGAIPLLDELPIDDSAVSYAVRAIDMHLGEFAEWRDRVTQEIQATLPKTTMPHSVVGVPEAESSPVKRFACNGPS
jgi:hypothetical protein